MAAFSCIISARNSILKHMRLQPPLICVQPYALWTNNRYMSVEAKGTYLDKSEVTDRVISVIKQFQKVDPAKVNPAANFQKDLGLDSLDAVELVMALEEEFAFEIPDAEADKIESIKLAIDYIASHPQAK
uniref:Acyl carrier protein n=1 Tax=Araucaria cunninghamii TaxID=56994 RepID=A0A0D6R5Q9_ARACU